MRHWQKGAETTIKVGKDLGPLHLGDLDTAMQRQVIRQRVSMHLS